MMRTQISLTAEERRLLDEEAERTGRSISALIRDAVTLTYGAAQDAGADHQAIDAALGAWDDRGVEGSTYVEHLRSGRRLDEAAGR